MVAVHFLWKWTVIGDETGTEVSWFGIDLSVPLGIVTQHVANTVYWLVSLVRPTVHIEDTTIWFDSGSATTIVWGCSGIKQAIVWLGVMLTTRSWTANKLVVWGQKLAFLPVGWLCCYLFNIFRITLITFAIEFHPDWFGILHDWILKYLFYLMLFGLWAIFAEKIRSAV